MSKTLLYLHSVAVLKIFWMTERLGYRKPTEESVDDDGSAIAGQRP